MARTTHTLPSAILALLCAGALAISLAGCATETAELGTGTAAHPMAAKAAANNAIPSGKARITLTRESSLVYAAAPATVTLNGKEVASVATGGSATVDVPAGDSTIAVSAWSYPGASTVKVALKAGQTTALEISPRSASVGAGMLLGPLGGLVDGSTEASGGAFDVRVVGGGR